MSVGSSHDTGILSGLRVVEVASFIFGPVAATIMTDFGAEVVKVEPPGIGDPYRILWRTPPMPVAEVDYCWTLDARNKRSISIDLKKDAGRQIVLRLLEGADVFVTNYQPSVLTQLRLRHEDIAPLHPRLIYAHATGYGLDGADVEQPGFDMTAYWARSGLMSAVAPADSEPALSVAGMGDHPSATALFGGIMLALYRRERTGRGSYVSTSLMANGAWANGCFLQAAMCGGKHFVRQSHATALNALVNHYVCQCGRRFILCCLAPARDWPALCRAIEMPDLEHDPRFATGEQRQANSRALIAVLDERFGAHDWEHWRSVFARHGIVWSRVPDAEEVIHDEQMIANRVLVPIEGAAQPGLHTVSSPIEVRDVAKVRPRPAPSVGQHTREVLTELGYPAATIDALVAEKVVQEQE
ncbi:MAG: CaiB/BaiF CoA transferase family protein [Pirellulales bacterium]